MQPPKIEQARERGLAKLLQVLRRACWEGLGHVRVAARAAASAAAMRVCPPCLAAALLCPLSLSFREEEEIEALAEIERNRPVGVTSGPITTFECKVHAASGRDPHRCRQSCMQSHADC